MFDRRSFVFAAGGLVFAPLARSQQPGKRLPRIGFLLSFGSASKQSPYQQSILEALREFGYAKDRDYVLATEFPEGQIEKIPGLVEKLIRQDIDIFVTTNNVAIRSAQKLTKTIPIVMTTTVDPVAAGYVESLARPGGNITGVALLTRDLSAKRIEILRELNPKMAQLAVLWDADGPGPKLAIKAYEAAAQKLRVRLQSLPVRGPVPDLDGAFKLAREGKSDALIVVTNPLLNQREARIAELARINKLPAMYENSPVVSNGGLLSYEASTAEIHRKVASYIARILKGASPATLPIEQPTRFELVLNAKAAKAIGVIVPQSLLLRADQIIE
jgi:putative ABC transport system substrate-binding protein